MRLAFVASLLTVAALSLVGRPAAACGEAYPSTLTLTGSVPQDGEVGVPLDVGIVLFGERWPDFPVHTGSPRLRLRLTEAATGTEVAGEQVGWVGPNPSFAWRPRAPLAPNREYLLHGWVETAEALPAGVDGPLELDALFVTGEVAAAPLVADGAISVEMIRELAPVCLSPDPCGGCERPVDRERAAVRIHIPGVQGGYGAAYGSWSYVTDDEPATFAGPGEATEGGSNVNLYVPLLLTPGEPAVVTIPVPDEAAAYRPCFSVNVWDSAGHTLTPAPVCLETMVPSEHVGISQGGCSAAARSRDAAPWALGLALAAMAGWRRRRRG